ncbi:MAG: SCO family protein [Dehalococcoidia bacterium]
MAKYRVIAALLSCLVVAGLLLSACGRAAPAPQPAPRPTPIPAPAAPQEKVPAPGFTLINQDGQTVSLRDFRGKVVLIDFIYTSCTTMCPILSAKFAQLQKALGEKIGREVVLLSISFDPEYDTLPVLKEYARRYQADPDGWHFLIGSLEDVEQVTLSYGVFYRLVSAEEHAEEEGGHAGTHERAFQHTALTVVVDQDGMLRLRFLEPNYDINIALQNIYGLLAEGARQASPSPQTSAVPAETASPPQKPLEARGQESARAALPPAVSPAQRPSAEQDGGEAVAPVAETRTKPTENTGCGLLIDSRLIAQLDDPDLEEYLECNSIPEAEAYLNRLVEMATAEGGWHINARWEGEVKFFLLDQGPAKHLALLSGENVNKWGNKGAVVMRRGEDRNELVIDAFDLLGLPCCG